MIITELKEKVKIGKTGSSFELSRRRETSLKHLAVNHCFTFPPSCPPHPLRFLRPSILESLWPSVISPPYSTLSVLILFWYYRWFSYAFGLPHLLVQFNGLFILEHDKAKPRQDIFYLPNSIQSDPLCTNNLGWAIEYWAIIYSGWLIQTVSNIV